jgi:hypothetical protein
MSRFVGTKVEFGADTDEFALNIEALELPVNRDKHRQCNCAAALDSFLQNV